ncbi:DUF6907 domain-containing protein [Streptomyces sp. NBC_00212]|uniref:DUF6907 domain-containing protein n=1 Tax=Streptomyces sp. NBC_00212 TaxID=2975684 RepID=UPI0032559015
MKSLTCPDWCVVEHDDAPPVDTFHRGANLVLKPPTASAPDQQSRLFQAPAPLPVLRAELMLPEVQQDNDLACIILDHHDVYGPYAQLDVESADQYIRDLKTFTARLQQMRDQLTALNGVDQ